MLEIENLRFRYSRRGPLVLDGVNLELKDGEIGILLGKNGSGKTTLFKTILGIEKPESGAIRFDGEDLLRMNRRERARRIAYVPQSIHFGALSVYDTVLMGRVSYFGYKAGRAASGRRSPLPVLLPRSRACWCSTSPRGTWISPMSSSSSRRPAGSPGRKASAS